MNNKLILKGNNKSNLSISFSNVLSKIRNGQEYKWKILYLEATTETDLDIIDLEEKIRESELGYLISWEDLVMLSNQIYQTIEVLLIGDMHLHNLKRYVSENEMYLNCNFCFELVDSSYWEISCKDVAILNEIKDLELDSLPVPNDTPPSK
jgi:hypothetical protein